jgi:plasmid stabilization system protein ParE
MVQEVTWTREALENLQEIFNYISRDSFFYAERTVQLIYKVVGKLEGEPEIGMVIQLKSKYTLRRILVKSFRVIYCFHSNRIFIVAVFRQSRQTLPSFDFIESYF